MKFLEKILVCLILIALILKFNLISGGDEILILSLTTLSCVYYPLGFAFFNQIRLRTVLRKDSYKNTSALEIIFAIVTGIVFSVICVGILFKVMIFTGADEMLTIGIPLLTIIIIITLIRYIKIKSDKSLFILKRAILLGVVGVFLFSVSPVSIVEWQFRNHPLYVEAYAEFSKDPTNKNLQRKRDLEYYRIVLNPEDFKRYEKSTK